MSSLQFNDKMEWCWWRMYGRWGRLYNFILVFLVLESHFEMEDFLRTFASMALKILISPRGAYEQRSILVHVAIKVINKRERLLKLITPLRPDQDPGLKINSSSCAAAAAVS